jgi:hypothetical protein
MAVRQNHGMLPEIDAKSQLSRYFQSSRMAAENRR